ncbi:MAG: hypothetical protein ACI4L9_04200, partial [Candidatus Coproplasma sp.]
MSTENAKKTNKKAAIITYLIALIVIVGGWFIPLLGSSELNLVDRMAFWYLPDIFNKVAGSAILPESIVTRTLPAFDQVSIELFGFTFNPLAILYLAYAAVAVIAIIMLIPVLAGNKEKSTSAVCAYVVEILATLVIALFLVFSAYNTTVLYSTLSNHLPLLIVGGALILILLIQSFINKKSLGVLKLFIFLLSAIAFVSLFNIVGVITYSFGDSLATTLAELLENIKSGLFFMPVLTVPTEAFLMAMTFYTN